MLQSFRLFFKFVIQKRTSSTVGSCSTETLKQCDVAVVGGGIIGAAVARKIKQSHNELNIVLLEKECTLAKHQSSHNSGVIHSGIFYKPNSLKAKFCRTGAELLQKYCTDKKITCLKVGKIILALNYEQIQDLETLYKRGMENEIQDLYFLSTLCEIRKICGGCDGLQALWIPNVYVVNFKDITKSLAEDFNLAGGEILYNFKLGQVEPSDDCENPVLITSSDDEKLKTKFLILCGGLQSQTLSQIVDNKNNKQTFITLRAKYFVLESQNANEMKTNIYKVPNLRFPFLGAHITPTLNNKILLGPWVVPSLTVDSYKCSDANLDYVKNLLLSRNVQKMILRNIWECADQTVKDLCYDLRIKEMQELVPNLPYQHLKKHPVALQTQLLNSDGTFADDFVFSFFEGVGIQSRTINLKFTPSPAATSCLSIADFVQQEFCKKLKESI